MEGWKVGRSKVGRWLVLGVLLSNIPPFPLSAQVGHAPGSSPYKDILVGMGLVFYGGYMTGGQGDADVGITNATVFGGRFELPLSGVLRLSFGMGAAQGERFVVDPLAPAETRKSGPVPDDVLFVETQGFMSLTGGKTWHKLAPFLTLTGGVAYGGDEPAAETSAYRFGTKLYYGGGPGVRWYPAARVTVAADFRLLLWRLKYPPQFFIPPAGSTPVVNIGQGEYETVRQSWMRLGLGWTF